MEKTIKKKVASKRKPAVKKPTARKRASATYEPKPLSTLGWAPFRYPPQ